MGKRKLEIIIKKKKKRKEIYVLIAISYNIYSKFPFQMAWLFCGDV